MVSHQLAVIALLGLTWTTVVAQICPQILPPSLQQPSSVHRVRPSDVAALVPVGPHLHSSELADTLARLRELLALFNPVLISPISDQTHPHVAPSSPHSSLTEQAREAVLYLQNSQLSDVERDWKLVLLVVQVDQICAHNEEQVESVVKAKVQEVDEALQLLHSALKQTIVSVALWDGGHHHWVCPCVETHSEGELRLLRATLTQLLQESLEESIAKANFHVNRDDFAVVLQETPLLTHQVAEVPPATPQGSLQTDKLLVQMWTNLLQPKSEQEGEDDQEMRVTLPCPTESRPFLRTGVNSPSQPVPATSPLLHPVMGTNLPCDELSPSPSIPTTVHALRPADIAVVAAVGDSLTAGNGVASSPSNILDVLRQYRGLSWSAGGNENLTTVTTLPNILKLFNPLVTGYSVGMGKEHTPQAFLNQAVAGDKSGDIPTQVRALVARMKNDSRINFKSNWKVITVFIGGNDLCDHCYNSLYYSVDNFVRNVREGLDYLHKQVPRALVNLVEPLHITPLRAMHKDKSLKCPTWLVNILCPCVILPKSGSRALQRLEDLNRAYQRSLQELVESGRYDTKPDFTVVVQPLLREIIVPTLADGRPDRSYFSADCFHLSQRAQTQMARALWNNMFEPLDNKTVVQDFSSGDGVKCPTKASPYIRTYKNSNYTYAGPTPSPTPVPNWGSDFSCKNKAPSSSIPTSVHRLRPADIRVVAALGDSLTAGAGAKAKTLLDITKEYKGVSWSIGGDQTLDKVTTLPNILRNFNPSLKGFSKGQGSLQKGFNMAKPGAKSSDIPAQIQQLVKAMKGNKQVDFEQDWKLVTIFVGGNDLCNYCLDQDNLSPKNYSHNIMLSLDLLRNEVPRVLVNVVEVLQIEPLRTVKRNTLGCGLLQRVNCPCVINTEQISPEIEDIKRINHQYQAELQHLISGTRYDGKEDFAVVLQPFLRNSFVPYVGAGEADQTFFSLDCFHISERAHAEMAIALWNNMLEPVGRKQAYNNFTYDRSKIHCPSEAHPFIFTKINSLPSPPVAPTTTAAAPVTDTSSTSGLPPTLPVLVCPPSLQLWVPVVASGIAFLAGVMAASVVLMCVQRQRRREEKAVEMKGTGF